MTKNSAAAVDKPLTAPLKALERQLGPIEYRPTASLTAYEANPRRHPEKQIVKLMGSISEFGFALPVLVDADLAIIAGHARIEAARRLGISDVPVLVASKWSAAQVRAYRLADNRLAELACWDDDLLAVELSALIEIDEVPIELLGWETGEIALLTDGASAERPRASDPADDAIPELADVPVSRSGDLWLLGRHRLLCGAPMAPGSWKNVMDGGVGAMAFIDSLYACPLSPAAERREGPFALLVGSTIDALNAYLRDGAVLDVCIDWCDLAAAQSVLDANHLSSADVCVWSKGKGCTGDTGSLYRAAYELILVGMKGEASAIRSVAAGTSAAARSNLWTYPAVSLPQSGAAVLGSASVKPVALVADAIAEVTAPGEIVLDAFVGFGTAVIAAERVDRRAYGIEIRPECLDVAIRRWAAMTGAEAVLAETGETFANTAARRASDNHD